MKYSITAEDRILFIIQNFIIEAINEDEAIKIFTIKHPFLKIIKVEKYDY